MTPHVRKLLPPDDHISSTTNSSLSKLSSKFEERENPTTTGVNCCAYNNLNPNPPFDSAMALTVLVLLTALFFMGFFSIYIRRFADESSVDPNRRRRSSGNPDSSSTTSYMTRSRASAKGVDPTTIQSLPVHAYDGGAAKEGIEIECVICLSEFEKREWVKEIPYCGHVFHLECIDTWLSSHVTCPLCRTAELLPLSVEEVEGQGHVEGEEEMEESEFGVGEVQVDLESGDDVGEREVRLTVDRSDTWSAEEREVVRLGARRSTSCSWLAERVALHRSLSF